jgi:hypothetical protein
MPSDYDPSEFIDRDLRSGRKGPGPGSPAFGARAPTREEMDGRVSETQIKLAELKRAQEELERERGQIEEMRRRQAEFQSGREEMLQHLTRGIGILEEAGFTSRRDAEQMGKTVGDLKDFQAKVQALTEEYWTKENLNVEMTKALTTVENARMEWNSALLKFPLLSGPGTPSALSKPGSQPPNPLASLSFWRLCQIGLALTFPVVLTGLVIAIILLLRR